MNFRLFRKLINEIHFTDYYGPAFVAFRKKYQKILKSPEHHKLSYAYVNFSNFKDDKLDRTAAQITDHHDPVGTYCYPIKYVLEHPADIWYGGNAKFMRVIQAVQTDKILRLQ